MVITGTRYQRNSRLYMSLIANAIKLSATEKELHVLNYPFRTIAAIKIAKLAVAQLFSEKYKGIGSFMITAGNEESHRLLR
jgi:hypothetical protein